MSRNRRFHLVTVLLSLCALLFAQTALAAYACARVAQQVQVAQMAEAGLPCAQDMAHAMDEAQPALCHAHCQDAPQSVDNTPVPALPTAMSLAPVLHVDVPVPPRLAAGPQLAVLRVSASPPLAVRNCCLRI